jgi:hypothetical protein
VLNWPIDVDWNLFVNSDNLHLVLLDEHFLLRVNDNTLFEGLCLIHWLFNDDWNLNISGNWSKERNVLISIESFDSMLFDNSQDAFIQS